MLGQYFQRLAFIYICVCNPTVSSTINELLVRSVYMKRNTSFSYMKGNTSFSYMKGNTSFSYMKGNTSFSYMKGNHFI